MNRFLRYGLIVGGALMSILLFFLTTASENSAHLQRYFEVLLVANGIVAFALLSLVGAALWRLFSRYRKREFGSRIMTRLVLLFALVGILPGTVIYAVSVQFLSSSIESWFDVEFESSLKSGLNLGRTALDFTLADLENKARTMGSEISQPSDASLAYRLARLREQLQVQEATIVTGRGRLVTSSNANPAILVPELPSSSLLGIVRRDRLYGQTEIDGPKHPEESEVFESLTKEPASKTRSDKIETRNSMRSRVIIPLQSTSIPYSLQSESLYLQLIHPVPAYLSNEAEALRNTWTKYQTRSKERDGLKTMYLVTLTLTLLLAIFAAITSAFVISGQLAKPLLMLAEGTKAVAEGNLSPRPIITSSDELGSLTQSFNIMTHQLFDARMTVERNRTELENAKVYLESVLGNMSAGVMVLDQNGLLVTCNASVARILQLDMNSEIGQSLDSIPGMSVFANLIEQAFSDQHAQNVGGSGQDHWQKQIEIPRLNSVQRSGQVQEDQSITLLARGSHLPVASGVGYVVVFDDISDIISAQRSIAWGEVARRLAHEIKNPLTPIQLSAERLQMKLQDKLSPEDALILNKSTTTIVNQVASMKNMVDDFRDYAKIPQAVLSRLNLSSLIDDVLHLYLSGDGRDFIHLQLEENLPLIMGDPTQLRQVIHNLLQNAQDALTEIVKPGFIPRIDVMAELVRYNSADQTERSAVRLTVIDNGPGFSNKILARAFEPYATSKPRGTGLGLAMVKKIVDEHGGKIDIQNRIDTNGAKISILLLKLAPNQTAII